MRLEKIKFSYNKQNPLGLWDQVHADIPACRYTCMILLVTMHWFYAKRQTKAEKAGEKDDGFHISVS